MHRLLPRFMPHAAAAPARLAPVHSFRGKQPGSVYGTF